MWIIFHTDFEKVHSFPDIGKVIFKILQQLTINTI
jgi:hypothetical protein